MRRRREKEVYLKALPSLNRLHYNEDRVMIGHEVVPMDKPAEGVFWCSVCGGHPDDPVHQPGYVP